MGKIAKQGERANGGSEADAAGRSRDEVALAKERARRESIGCGELPWSCEADAWLPCADADAGAAFAPKVRRAFARARIRVSPGDLELVAAARRCALAERERVEFGEAPVGLLAEELACSAFLFPESAVNVLLVMQDCFYRLRDDVPPDVPDEEIVNALTGYFDEVEGDIDRLESVEARDILEAVDGPGPFEDTCESGGLDAYRIIDDVGREYVFRPGDWSYDECSCGWDGEGWDDDLD